MGGRSLFSGGRLALRIALCAAALLCLALVAGGGQRRVRAAGTYTIGNENSWIRVQNIGSDNANVEIDYFDDQGHLAAEDTCPSSTCPAMYPGSGWTFFQRDNPSLPSGFKGSAVISTDQPIVALLAKDIFRGSVYSSGGSTMTLGAGSHRLFLPLTNKHDGAQGTWNGRFAIQNMSDTVQACVTITYLSNAADDEVAWEPFKLPASGGTASNPLQGCPNGGMPLAPRASLFRFPDNMPVPDKFAGSVRIDLSKNGQGQDSTKQFVAATEDSFDSQAASFDSYAGFDEGDLGTEFILPLIDRQVGPGNSYSTRFEIANKSPQSPASVTLRFDGYDLSSGTPRAVTKTNVIALRAARMCYQAADDATNCLVAGDKLPSNFVGTVRLTSTQPIGIVVDRSTTQGDTFVDYRGVRPQDAGRRILLPVLNKNYGAVSGQGNGWNSWFRVMVADGGQANVTVHYYGIDLPSGSYSYTQAVNREFTVFQNQDSNLPDGFAGTAIIESDRPIVALGDLTNDVLKGDPDLLYNGVPIN